MCFFFFFKQKTAYEIYQCDWSSDVCSSDLVWTRSQERGENRFVGSDGKSVARAEIVAIGPKS